MPDIAITTYTNKTYKSGASTVVPGFVEGSPGSPVNPPGSGATHNPVTIGSPANGLSITDDQVLTYDGSTIPTAAVIGRYDIDTSGTTAPVGTKDIRYNNATQISATQLFISDITEDNIDVDLFLSLIKQGSALVIQDRDDHLNYQTYEVSGTPTFASDTWTFPVTFKDSGGTGTTNFANNDKVLLSALSSGSGSDPNKVSYNVADSKNATERNQARVNIGSTSATPQIIATAGAINDLTVTSNSLVFTGASVVLSGIVAGLDGEEIAILNASGTNLELLSQSVLSSANNRFASGVVVPNLSIVRIKYRTTTARWVFENVSVNDARYLRKDVADTKLGDVTFNVGLGTSNFFRIRAKDGVGTGYEYVGTGGGRGAHRWDGRLDDAPYIFSINGNSSLTTYRQNQSDAGLGGGNRAVWSFLNRLTLSGEGHINFDHTVPIGGLSAWIIGKNSGGTEILRLRTDGTFFHQRSSGSTDSVRRDELYLNYSQTVATAGTINDLAINADCKLLILTGATDLTGVVFVDNTRLLRIEARGGARIIRDQSASSTDVNRFALGADLTINDGEVYQFIYTNSRWRRVL